MGEAIVQMRVAERVQQLRKERGWNQQQLADAVAERGWQMDRTAIVRIESGKRGVSVDDLTALAAALNVSPGWLLLPTVVGDEEVPLVGSVTAPGWAAWQWVDGVAPLPTRAGDDDEWPWNTPEDEEGFQTGRPPELRQREQHSATRAARDLVFRVHRVLSHVGKPRKGGDRGIETTLRAARSAVARVVAELDDLEAAGQQDRRR